MSKKVNRESKTFDNYYCSKCAEKGLNRLPTPTKDGKPRYKCSNGHIRITFLRDRPPVINAPPKIAKKGRIIITSLINDTGIEGDFLKSLENAKEHFNKTVPTQLFILQNKYRNTDAWHSGGANEEISWHSDAHPYLLQNNLVVNKNLEIYSNFNVTPTAVNPLSGMESIGGQRSIIFAHPQIRMLPVASPKNHYPKLMYTTGSISKKDSYTKSKTGIKAKYHHKNSALIIDYDTKEFHVTHIEMDEKTKGFYLFDEMITKDSVVNYVKETDDRPSIVFGDLHEWPLSKPKYKFVRDILWDKDDSVCKTLEPKHMVLHDIYDGFSGSHHHRNNFAVEYRKHVLEQDSVSEELNSLVVFLNKLDKEFDSELCIVHSNHDEHLDKWLNSVDARRDFKNSKVYHLLMYLLIDSLEKNGTGDALKLYLRHMTDYQLTFVSPNDEFLINGVDCSQHGDRGVNGARGVGGYSKTSRPMVHGHTHTPYVTFDVMGTGVLPDEMDYAKGMGTWMKSSVLIYPNGTKGHIHIIGKRNPLNFLNIK